MRSRLSVLVFICMILQGCVSDFEDLSIEQSNKGVFVGYIIEDRPLFVAYGKLSKTNSIDTTVQLILLQNGLPFDTLVGTQNFDVGFDTLVSNYSFSYTSSTKKRYPSKDKKYSLLISNKGLSKIYDFIDNTV
jgi:hypothetical protein